MSDNSIAVRVERIWKVFDQKAEKVQAVRNVTLAIKRGEFTAVAGPSGSGKTTLLNLIGGLTRPSRGQIWVAGCELTEMSTQALAHLRLNQIGFIFQAYNLLPVLTALENAEFPMLLQGVEANERSKRVRELFARTNMTGLENRRPGQLSGGQQQRVAVIRAVASKPALVIADEPTANLDSATSEALLNMMLELNQELGVTFVFATHDQLVMKHARRLIRMMDGAIDFNETKV
jgi:putative ABC transport system ATP-binding protein